MNSVNKTRKLVGTAMLSAVGAILMYIGIKLPFMPSFITLDMADLPALIGSFAYGPARGAVICVLKNLLHLLIQGSQTGGVGEISNALLGIFFVVPAGLIYNKIKSKKGAFIGALVGAVAMAVMSIFSNYYFVYPVYTNFMPMEAIIAAYSAINPKVTNLWQALIMFNMPFTFMKGMISLAISMLIYKPLSPILKGKR
ncbi:MAG: ECF transporter S component [Oscillospiraceae bacterium]|nr:ECF transporter S component [Oscillospiraceae bacterium]